MVKPLRTTLLFFLGLVTVYFISYWILVDRLELQRAHRWSHVRTLSPRTTETLSSGIGILYAPALHLHDHWRVEQLKHRLRGTWVSSDGHTTLTMDAECTAIFNAPGEDGATQSFTCKWIGIRPRARTMLMRPVAPQVASRVPVYSLHLLSDGALLVEATHVSGRGLPACTLRRTPAPTP